MIKQLTSFIIEAIRNNGPISVFSGGVIEQVISPIPSVLIPMSAGFLLIPKNLYLLSAILQIFYKISFPYALGATIGSSLLYLVSLYGGRALVERYGKFLGISLKNIDKFMSKFTRGFKDEVLLLFLLVLPITPISIVAATCGLLSIAPVKFYPLLFIGTFLRSIFLAVLGWKTEEAYESIASGLDKTESILSILIIGLVFILFGFLYYKREKFFNSA